MNLDGSNLLKCGGRQRVWLELGIVASLLGAIRIQLIMMIYYAGHYVGGSTSCEV